MPETRLSLVAPVYNEADNLRPLIAAVHAALDPLAMEWELIAVDDGSNDGSSALLDELAQGDARLRVLHFERNAGQSDALDAGFRHASGSVIGLLDADLQTDPGDIPLLLGALDDADAVVGIRVERHDTGWRRFSSRFANGVRNRLTREDIVDTGCPLKLFRAEAIKRVTLWKGAHRFLPTLLRMEGLRVVQVPVRHRERQAGASKYGTLDRAFRGLRDALGVRWLQDRHLTWRLR